MIELPPGAPALMSGGLPASRKEQDEPAPKKQVGVRTGRKSTGRDPHAARIAEKRLKEAKDAQRPTVDLMAAFELSDGEEDAAELAEILSWPLAGPSACDGTGRSTESVHNSESDEDDEEDDTESDYERGPREVSPEL